MIELVLPYPISANRYWSSRAVKSKATGRQIVLTHPSTEAQAYRKAVLALFQAAGITAPIAGRVAIEVDLYPSLPKDWQKRQRQLGAAWDDSVQCIDLDNANKVLLDTLKGVVIEDDRWVRQLIAQRLEPDEQGARVVVRITPLHVEQPQASLLGEAA